MHGRLDRKTFLTTLGAAGLGIGLTATTGARSALAHERAPAGAPAGGMGPLDERLQQRESFYQDFTAALAEALRRAPLNGPEPNQSGAKPTGQEPAGAASGQEGANQGGRGRSRTPADQSGAATPESGAPQGSASPHGGQSNQGATRPSETTPGGMPSGADAVDAAIRQALMAMIDARQAQGGLTYGQAEAVKTLIATDMAPIAPAPFSLLWLGAPEGGEANGQREPEGQQAAHGAGGEPSRPSGGASGQRGMGGDQDGMVGGGGKRARRAGRDDYP